MKKILVIAAIAAASFAITGCEKQDETSSALSALKSDANKAAKDAQKAADAAAKEAGKQADAAKKAAANATK